MDVPESSGATARFPVEAWGRVTRISRASAASFMSPGRTQPEVYSRLRTLLRAADVAADVAAVIAAAVAAVAAVFAAVDAQRGREELKGTAAVAQGCQ